MKRAFAVVDLGFGDAGKGSIVDALTRRHDASLVVRFNGGCQAAHNVVQPDGRHHLFAQFGAGSFHGANTHLSQHVLVEPYSLFNEGRSLASTLKVDEGELFRRLTVDPLAKITTPFHKQANHWVEKQRGSDRHGSCGRGIGETMQHYIDTGMALYAHDLAVRGRSRSALSNIYDYYQEKYPSIEFLSDVDQLVEDYREFGQDMYLAPDNVVLDHHDTVIFEGAQGVLLDEDWGFPPHVTWSRTTDANVRDIVDAYVDWAEGVDLTTYGVMRTYMTRHGAGPLPTETNDLYLPEKHNGEHEWQGAFRIGRFDLTLIQYALRLVDVDELAITFLDRFMDSPLNMVSHRYENVTPQDLHEAARNERLGVIERAVPDYTTVGGVARQFIDWIQDNTGKPATIHSYGPTHKDKRVDTKAKV